MHTDMHPKIKDTLAALSVPWELKEGGRHRKLFVNGRLAGILPKGRTKDSSPRDVLNTIAQIKRVARGDI
jgi:hypothetical protein